MAPMKMEVPAAGDQTPAKEWTDDGCDHGAPPCFDCGICLEPAGEPVVTPCGHLYCGPCLSRWTRSGQPGAAQCPVCKAAVSEDRLVQLYGRGVERRGGDDELRSDVQRVYGVQDQHGHAGGDMGWVLHSNAGRVIASAASAMLPWAFPGGSLPLPPRPVIVCDGQRQRRVEDSLHQLWLFLAVAALLCFLLT